MTPCFFGYGSLVNRATHNYPNARPAILRGWRRVWVKTPHRDVVFLSIRPEPGDDIDGLIASVPGADWNALDLRETGYRRLDVTPWVTSTVRPDEIAVYQVPPTSIQNEGTHHMLLSYLDVVVQGFLREFGPAGAAHFFATTDGWNTPVVDDRAAPLYPRAQELSVEERALTDRLLAQVHQRQ